MQYQLDMIQAAEEFTAKTSLSLNMDARKSESEQDLQRRVDRENERRAALDLEPVETLDDVEEGDFPDILLDQAAGIVTDLATLREVPSGPPQTARVQP